MVFTALLALAIGAADGRAAVADAGPASAASAAASAPAAVPKGPPATPFEGYGGMPWGTPIEEAKAKLVGAHLDASFGDAMPILVTAEEIAGTKARVNYYFVEGKLAQAEVDFQGLSSADEAVAQFDRVEGVLFAKYGHAWRDTTQDRRDPQLQESRGMAMMIRKWYGHLEWTKPGGQLELQAMWLPQGPWVTLTAKGNDYIAKVQKNIQATLDKSNEKGL